MGIALFATVRLFSPLSMAVAYLLPRTASRHRAKPPATHHGQNAAAHPPSARPRRPLRVVHIVDKSHAPTCAGRMTISGSMADVCAELDRLVQADSPRH